MISKLALLALSLFILKKYYRTRKSEDLENFDKSVLVFSEAVETVQRKNNEF